MDNNTNIDDFMKESICRCSRRELVERLKKADNIYAIEDEEVPCADYTSILESIKWLKEQFDFKELDRKMHFTLQLGEATFSQRQYTCYWDAIEAVHKQRCFGAYHQFCDFIADYSSEKPLSIIESLFIKLWVDSFEKQINL